MTDELQRLKEKNEKLRTLAASALSVVRDLDEGYPWRELHVNVDQLRDEAEELGITEVWDKEGEEEVL